MAERIFVKELLTHTGWLHRLARELVRDLHRADDLAQGSVAAALASPPRQGGAGLRAWLHRVMVNRLRQDRRNEATRQRLQPGVAKNAEAPSTLTLVARTEIRGALIQELVALEEPYRTTLLHRYYDGRSAADLAREEGLPESTVRSRLHRGLERLRERLRARYGGDDTQWLPAVAGLVRLARTQKLALAGVSLVGLAVLGTVLGPFRASSRPPRTTRAVADGRESPPARVSQDLPAADAAGDAPSSQRQALPGSGPETFEVRVLAPDGSPASKARVRFASLVRAREENLSRGGPQHPHSEVYRFAFLAEEYGEERWADDEGRAWLPVPPELLLVAASDDSGFATTTVPGEQHDPVTVRLTPEGSLELRTVDRIGNPAGNLPLRVAVRVPGKPDNTLWVGETGDGGAVTIPHFQLLQPEEGRSGARYGVCFDFPVQPHVTVGFDDPPPRDPVVLTVPEHGFLEVSFTDPEDAPLFLPVEYCRLQIDFLREGRAPEAFPPGQRRWTGGFPLPGEHSLRLPIGLDARITASGQFRPVGEIEEVSFPGPVRPGEVVNRTLQLSRRFTVVRGVLQHEGSALTGGIAARAVLLRGREQVAVQDPVLLDGGAFELLTRSRENLSGIYLQVRDSQGIELGKELSLPRGDVVSLGAVELAPLGRVLEGRVVDDRGSPVSGAGIQAWRWRDAHWVRDRRFQTTAGSEGRFRLFLPESEQGIALLAERRGYLAHGPVLPGPEPLEMVRSGEVAGSLVLPEWLEASQLSVRLEPLAVSSEVVEVEPQPRGGRTVFRARDLWPGRYRIRVQVDGEPEPFRDLGVLDLEAGAQLTADRLNGVDLRSDVFRMELTAADALGAPLDLPGAGLAALVPGADGTVHRRNLRWTDGRAVLVTSHPSLEVEMIARGYQVWRGTVHAGQTVLTLRPER